MKKKIIISYIICISFLASCSQNKRYEFYKSFKEQFVSEITDSFQVTKKKDIISCYAMDFEYPSSIEIMGYCGMSIVYDYTANIDEFKKKILQLDSFNLAKICSDDKSLLMINDTLPIKYNAKNSYPIYNDFLYYNYEIEKGIETLSKTNLMYYVLRYKKGLFVKDSSILKNVYQFSDAFYKRVYKHGYCNGATVDNKNKRIVYWTVVW